jgi:hypothetical protein
MTSGGLFSLAHLEVADVSLEPVDKTSQIAGALSNLIPAGPAPTRGEHRGVVGALLYPPWPLHFEVSAPLYLPPAATEPPSSSPCPTRLLLGAPPLEECRHSPELDANTPPARGTRNKVGVASRCGCCCADCLGPAKVGCAVEDGAPSFPSLSA